ncbi:MAG: hypothetical protein K2Q26_11190, partial [Bdellovibrionales bacterium]|nr:hypothetical protein [Bdellovibrionales bacterium]
MADKKLPFIFSKMKAPKKFTSIRQFFPKTPLPPRNPKEHRKYLLDQLSNVEKHIQSKSKNKLAEAKGAVVAVKRAEGSQLKVDSLGDKLSGVRVLFDIPEERTTILDVSKGDLSALKKKINAYGEKPKVSSRSKSKVPKPANNDLIAPIESIVEVDRMLFSLVWGPKLSSMEKAPKKMNLFGLNFPCVVG